LKFLSLLLLLISINCFADVLQGIDRVSILKDKLIDKRVAVLTHFAGHDNKGIHLIDKVINNKLNLTLIFAPEHGLRTLKDDYVDDGIDPKTGVKIISLYKKDKRFPSNEDIEKFDVLIIDLKDVGVRFYTYAGTIFQTIKKIIAQGKEVYLLDRVNPLSGKIAGPILDSSLTGHSISYFPVPQSHGLTMGEYMNFVLQSHPKKSLIHYVKLKGWTRNMIWDDTGIKWLSPSPALPTSEQSYLYGIFGSFESLNISVGRSQTNKEAFYNYGAPWITKAESKLLTNKLNSLKLTGLKFFPAEWKVTRSDFKGKTARGFRVKLIDFKQVNRFKALYKSLRVFKQLFKDRTKFNHWAKRYLGSESYVESVNNNVPYLHLQKVILKDELDFFELVKGSLFY
jgi:uncharacterized protein YbbC (DUF1343 family)